MNSKPWLSLCLLLALVACSEAAERPPLTSDSCGAALCTVPAVAGARTGKSGAPSPAPAPTTTAGSSLAAGEIFGEVLLVSSPDLSRASRALTEPLTVYGPGATREIEAPFEPGGEFRLRLDTAPPWWLRVEPGEGSPELLTTVQGVSRAGQAQLFVIERQTLADVSESLTRNPVALDPDRGHAIIHLVDKSGAALVGATVEPSSGILAYDIGETYTDATDTTATRGAVAIFNVAASGPPGAQATLRVFAGGKASVSTFPVVRDALTSAVFVIAAP